MPRHIRRELEATLLGLARSELLAREEPTAALREITRAAAAALDCERVGVWLFGAGRAELRCADLFEHAAAGPSPP